MKRIYLTLSAALLLSMGASSQTVITVTDASLTGSTTWTNNNVYMLDGFVFLESGTLTIQPGTVIKGKAVPSTGDNASALIITTGAKIDAQGTAATPIIFTSEIDDLNSPNDLTVTDNGLWGGLIILGEGVLGNSTATANVEGIPTTELRAVYGGSNNADTSGVLKYVSIRHGGAELSPGDEINGLTLGGVGSGTVIEHIEVISNQDDGVEFFGGAVSPKWVTVAFCGDDAFDWDLGWIGKGQFWFAIQRADDGDHGGELDGAKPDNNPVFSNPTIYNATFIGAGTSGTATNTNALIFRDGTGGTFANSIFTDFVNKAIEVEDLAATSGLDSYQRLQNGELNLKNNLWYGFGSYTTLDATATGIIRVTASAEDPSATTLINHLTTNNNQLTNPMLNSISRTANAMLDPRPQTGSPALTGLAALPANDPFFASVGYKGAFDANGANFWLQNWTALDEYGFLPNITSVNAIESSVINVNAYPNPATDNITISYTLTENADVKVEVYDMYGRLVAEANSFAQAGAHTTEININRLSQGVYMYKVNTAAGSFSGKFLVL